MRSHVLSLTVLQFSFLLSAAAAQTLTIAIPNRPSIVEVFTTNAEGLPSRTTITTLSGSAPPTASPFPPSNSPAMNSFTSSFPSSKSDDLAQPTTTSPPLPSSGLAPGVIAGIAVAVLVILVLVALAVFFMRRRNQRRRRLSIRTIDPVVSTPVYEQKFRSDPFLTDSQAKGLGLDVTQLSTRRIEAKFLTMDHNTSSPAKEDPYVPQILVTREGEINSRSTSTTPLGAGHHRPHSITGHTTSTRYSLDVKASHNSRGASPVETIGEGHSDVAAPPQAEIARRMRDLLVQLEHQVAPPGAEDRAVAMVQLQRQVEMLQRENEELRSTGADVAPPAYEGNGRF